MSSYKPSILISGPTGTVGSSVVKAILANRGQYGNLGVLAREESPKYNDLKKEGFEIELKSNGPSPIKGKYGVYLIAVNHSQIPEQRALIDFAIEAGIRTVYPSEFGVDVDQTSGESVFGEKLDIRKYLQKKHDEDVLDYVFVLSNSFIDYGLEYAFWGFDVKQKEVTILDGGDYGVSWSFVVDLGKLIARSFLDKSIRNSKINVTSIEASQLEITKEFEKQTGSKWTTTNYTVEEYANQGKDFHQKGDYLNEAKRSIGSTTYNKELSEKFSAIKPLRYSDVKVHTLPEIVADILTRS